MGGAPLDATSALGSLGDETVVIPTSASVAPEPEPASEQRSTLSGGREPIRVGEVLGDKYRIDRLIAKSGMGIVYVATHLDIEQPVAIKFLLESRKDPQAMARFKREARAMGRVRNDHAVRVLDVDELDADTPYIVMEYLEGRDLHSLMREIGKLPLAFTCDLLLQSCEALAAAHAEGVVHRDLKPSNIFVVPEPDGTAHVKVIDFGIAKLRGEIDRGEAVTHTSTLVGSPRYMSPEQVASSAEIDHRADVWALGVILQEMLTGQRCFEAQGVGPLLIAIATQPHRSILSVMPDAPPGIVEALERALQKNPALRTPDVLAFAESLARFTPTGPVRIARIRQVASRGSGEVHPGKLSLEVPSSPDLSAAAGVAETTQSTPRPRIGGVWILIAAGAIAFSLAAIVGAVLMVTRPAAPAPPPPPALVVTTSQTPTATTPATTAAPSPPEASAKPTTTGSLHAAPTTKPKASATKPAVESTKPRDLFDDPK